MLKPEFKYLLFITSLAMLFISIPDHSYSKDITTQVIKETPLDEQVSLFCTMYCLGNQRQGTLKSITLDQAGNNLYTVQGKAALRNRQVAGRPLNATIYDRTIIVNSVGTLNPETCMLTVDDVTVENDFQNIVTNILKSNSDIIGKAVEVPNCKKFLN